MHVCACMCVCVCACVRACVHACVCMHARYAPELHQIQKFKFLGTNSNEINVSIWICTARSRGIRVSRFVVDFGGAALSMESIMISYVTHMNESCSCVWVVSHNEEVTSHNEEVMSHNERVIKNYHDKLCHTYEWVMFMCMSRVTQWMSHVTQWRSHT